MAQNAKGSDTPSSVKLSYQLLRNTTSPDEQATGVKSFVVNIPAFEILKFDTRTENLRGYIAEYTARRSATGYTTRSEPRSPRNRSGSSPAIAGS